MKVLIKSIPLLFIFIVSLAFAGNGIRFTENKGQWAGDTGRNTE